MNNLNRNQQTRSRGTYNRTNQASDPRRSVQQKLQARRNRHINEDRNNQHVNSYSNGRSAQRNTKNNYSSKNEDGYRQQQKYFRKDKSQGTVRNKVYSNSQQNKYRGSSKKSDQNNQNNQSSGYQRANAQYMKLKDKLSFLQNKISDMKKNVQRKRQQKKKKEQQQKKVQIQKKRKQKRPSQLALNDFVTAVPQRKQLHSFQKDPYSPRHNIYYVSEIVRAYQDPKSIARQHLHTSLQIMAYFQKCQKPSQQKIAPKKLKLQRRKGYQDKKSVVFDLDQTLIHCNQSLDVDYDIKLPITFPNGQVIQAGINIRPYAKQLLKNLSKNFEIIVFTASHSCYANVVLDYLDPNKQYIHHRLYRQHCYATPQGMHVKDLRVINRQLSDMVLIDNAAYSYIYQLDNGIPILPYYSGKHDYQLKTLQGYIQQMLLIKDMRTINRKTFKLHMYKDYYSDLQKLVQDLYLTQHSQ